MYDVVRNVSLWSEKNWTLLLTTGPVGRLLLNKIYDRHVCVCKCANSQSANQSNKQKKRKKRAENVLTDFHLLGEFNRFAPVFAFIRLLKFHLRGIFIDLSTQRQRRRNTVRTAFSLHIADSNSNNNNRKSREREKSYLPLSCYRQIPIWKWENESQTKQWIDGGFVKKNDNQRTFVWLIVFCFVVCMCARSLINVWH